MAAGAKDVRAAGGFAFGAFRFAPEPRSLLLYDEPVRLGTRAFDILRILVERAGAIVTTDELLALVWPDVVVEETNLRVQIGALRKVLARGELGRPAIETVSRGYRFSLAVSRWKTDPNEVPSAEHKLHNLPALLATTVGRAETIALLADSLNTQRLITITGPGGVGKTTVAVAVARQCLRRFSDGICFVDFSSLSDPGLVATALGSALGISVLSNEPLAGLLSHLRKKEMLLVLDTCEHVVDSVAALVESLLSRLPDLRILTTSREILRATGEWAHRLSSLSHPSFAEGLSAAEALSYPAVDLFVQRARAICERFELQDADAATVAAICRRLDGMPLAIEFAAARMGELGLREIAARLDDRFSVLTQGRRTALPRHKTLAATLDWSYHLLPPEEQSMLRQLSVFRGAFTADAAIAVAGTAWPRPAALTYLSNLFAKSLVTADIGGETPLYRLLDTTRAFGAEMMDADEWQEVSARHAAHVVASLRAAEREYDFTDCGVWTERHRNSIDDLRGALDWALSESGDRDLGLQLLGQSVLLWYSLSLFGEYVERLKAVFEGIASMPIDDPATASRLWEVYGHAMWHTGGPIEAVIGAFRTSLEVARRAGLVDAQLRALWGLHLGYSHHGDFAESSAVAKEYESISAAVDAPGITLTRQRMTAFALHNIGDQAAARALAERVLADAASPTRKVRQQGVQFDSGLAIRPMLSRILWLQGHPKQAWDCAREGFELVRTLGQPLPLCYMLVVGVIPVAFWTGNIAAAKEFTETLVTLSLEHSLVLSCMFGQSYRALIEGTLDVQREPLPGTFLAEMIATFDAAAAAEATLERGEHDYERWSTPELLRIRASRLLARGDAAAEARAEAMLLRALEVARRQKALAWELRIATTLAEHWKGGRRHTEAHDLLSAVYRRFSEGFDTQDLVRAATVLEAK